MKINAPCTFVTHECGNPGYPLYLVRIEITPTVEEAELFSDFRLWELPLSVTIEGQKVDIINGRLVEAGSLTLDALTGRGFVLNTPDLAKALASKKLVMAALASIERLLVELKVFKKINSMRSF